MNINKHPRRYLSGLRLISFLTFLPASIWAQTPDQTSAPAGSTDQPSIEPQKIQELEKKIEALDERVKATENGAANAAGGPEAQAQPGAATASGGAFVHYGNDGVSLQTGDGNIQLKFGGDFQVDGRFYPDGTASPASDGFVIRRARPTFSGVVFKYVDFYVRPDFGLGTVVLYEAYVDLNYFSRFQLRVGKFKPPVGLERLQSDDDTTFAERGLPTLLVPSRDIGYQLSGDLITGRLNYAVGVFNGVADNSLADAPATSHRDFAARLFLTPFQPNHNFLSGLGVGVSGTDGSMDGIPLPAYKTFGQITFLNFTSGVASDGHRSRLAPQMYYYLGGFGLISEYTRADEELQKGTVRHPFDFRAWQVVASYVLTGEKKGFGSVIPRKNFDPRRHTWGAFELGVRVGDFDVDPNLFNYGFASITSSPRRAHEWVGGATWYLNRNLEIKLDAGNTNFSGGAAASAGGNRPSELTLIERFQMSF